MQARDREPPDAHDHHDDWMNLSRSGNRLSLRICPHQGDMPQHRGSLLIAAVTAMLVSSAVSAATVDDFIASGLARANYYRAMAGLPNSTRS
jgi:hypothetical protein